MQTQLLKWARSLQAIGQTGLYYAGNSYEKERFEQVRNIAAEMIAAVSNLTTDQILQYYRAEFGYATPKVDVRGVVFKDSKILLVREIADRGRWTVPGGWADVNESPAEAVVREVYEESGYQTEAVRLLAVYDREKQEPQPPYPFHIYKLFFLCEITGGTARPNLEASEIAFFEKDRLPELSVSRVTENQIRHFFDYKEHPVETIDFD